MKKFLLVLLLLLLPCVCMAQPFDIGANAEFGWLTEWECFIVNMDITFYINPNGFIRGTLLGSVEVLMEHGPKFGEPAYAFVPYMDRYSVGAVLNLSVFYFSVEHYCIHPVWSNEEQFWSRAYTENCTKFSVGMSKNYGHRVERRGR